MRAIKVAKAFTLRTDQGELLSFAVGVQPIADELADHWFVKAHLADECQPGTAEYVAAARADLKAAEDAAEQALHVADQKKADLAAAEDLLTEKVAADKALADAMTVPPTPDAKPPEAQPGDGKDADKKA